MPSAKACETKTERLGLTLSELAFRSLIDRSKPPFLRLSLRSLSQLLEGRRGRTGPHLQEPVAESYFTIYETCRHMHSIYYANGP